MHIFLTGEIQIGKSTVLNKTLILLGKTYGGFRTCFGADRASPDRCLYMNDASKPPVFEEEFAVVRFHADQRPESLTGRFDIIGSALIKAARDTKQIIVMDELGNFERSALAFQHMVMETLDGGTPVLGVIKKTASGWTDYIRTNPHVLMIDVVTANRDVLPGELTNMLMNRRRVE